MSWSDKYWDTIDQLYWDPSLLGLASIPKAEWQHGDGTIAIPSDRVRNGGSIYTRKGTAAENAERMQRLEEPLNHIFDITFGIAPDEAIQKFFLAPLGFGDPGPFLRLGREVATRYSGFANSNTTQQDAFYVGPQSLVGVELKYQLEDMAGAGAEIPRAHGGGRNALGTTRPSWLALHNSGPFIPCHVRATQGER